MRTAASVRAVGLAAVFFWILSPGTIGAQIAGGNIVGRIVDDTGGVLPDDSVTVSETETGLSRSTVTDEGGNYIFSTLPVGTYKIRVSLAGFGTQERELILAVGQTLTVNFTLKPAGIEVSMTTAVFTIREFGHRRAVTERKDVGAFDRREGRHRRGRAMRAAIGDAGDRGTSTRTLGRSSCACGFGAARGPARRIGPATRWAKDAQESTPLSTFARPPDSSPAERIPSVVAEVPGSAGFPALHSRCFQLARFLTKPVSAGRSPMMREPHLHPASRKGAPPGAPPPDDRRYKMLEVAMRKHGYAGDAVIESLHAAQEAFGYLDDSTLWHVARSLRLPPSKVYGVATFYNYFTLKPQGKHTCVVCLGTACYIKGARAALAAVEEHFRVEPGSTTPDRKLSLLTARCFGSCALAPAAVLDGEMLGKLTPQAIVERVEGAISR